MKNHLIALTILASLASCNNGSSSKPRQSVDLSKYKENLIPTRGLVALSTKTGTDKSYDFTGNEPTILVEQVNEKIKSIILKIEGDKIYKYIETEDLIAGSRTVKIDIEGNDDVKEIQNEPGVSLKLVNDTLFMTAFRPYKKFGGTYDTNGRTVEIMSEFNASFTVNMLKPQCDTTAVVSTNSYLLVGGVKDKTASDSTTEVTTCGGIMTDEEMKALDLSRIEACDYTVLSDEEYSPDCEFTDMSDLTADL